MGRHFFDYLGGSTKTCRIVMLRRRHCGYDADEVGLRYADTRDCSRESLYPVLGNSPAVTMHAYF